jgi:hypothetical protein
MKSISVVPLDDTMALLGRFLHASILDPKGLALGCGVEYDTLHRVFQFGRTDYLGPSINSAAKLQQLAWNEVILGPKGHALLEKASDVLATLHKPLPGRGYRISTSHYVGPKRRKECKSQ